MSAGVQGRCKVVVQVWSKAARGLTKVLASRALQV